MIGKLDIVMWSSKTFTDVGIVINTSFKKAKVMWTCGTIINTEKSLLRKII